MQHRSVDVELRFLYYNYFRIILGINYIFSIFFWGPPVFFFSGIFWAAPPTRKTPNFFISSFFGCMLLLGGRSIFFCF